MKTEEKDLLLKDLCARLPYSIQVYYRIGTNELKGTLTAIYPLDNAICVQIKGYLTRGIECIKPYLRPMSSMTDDEKAQVQMFVDIVTDENYGDGYSPSAWDTMDSFVQYCDSHHLDHRGLIFRSLALEAPEGMYDIK